MMPLNGASPRLPLTQSQRQGSTSTSLIFTIDTKRCRTKSYSQMSTEGIKPAYISNQRQEEVLLLSSLNSRKSNGTRAWERVWLQQEHILVTVKVSNWIFIFMKLVLYLGDRKLCYGFSCSCFQNVGKKFCLPLQNTEIVGFCW